MIACLIIYCREQATTTPAGRHMIFHQKGEVAILGVPLQMLSHHTNQPHVHISVPTVLIPPHLWSVSTGLCMHPRSVAKRFEQMSTHQERGQMTDECKH